jgi:uncharacterized membrane protein YhaH (DUF805 family)
MQISTPGCDRGFIHYPEKSVSNTCLNPRNVNSILVLMYLVYCFVPYPYSIASSINYQVSSFNTTMTFSKLSKDIVIILLSMGIFFDFITKKKINKISLIAIFFSLFLILYASLSTFLHGPESAPIRVILGIRNLSYFFIPLFLGLMISSLKLHKKITDYFLTTLLFVNIIHSFLVYFGIAQPTFYTSSGRFPRSVGVFGEPNLMAFMTSLMAIYFNLRTYYVRMACAVLLIASCFSITGLTPIIFSILIPFNSKRKKRLLGAILALPVCATLLARVNTIIFDSDYSVDGKIRSLGRVWDIFDNSNLSAAFFGRGFSIVDSAGRYLNAIGLNREYFQCESTYAALLIQFGLISVAIFLFFIALTVRRLHRRVGINAWWAKIIILSTTISNLGLLYFSIFPVVSLLGFSMGIAWNEKIVGKKSA